ncbi:MAG: TadE/TadG family type IV pilus assembly protein [Bryobacteraceae bacterium]
MRRRKGSTVVEFTLVGVPLMFVLLGTFEMARGIWTYHTFSYAVKEGTRLAVVHGANCYVAPNNCPLTVGQIADRIRRSAVGLDQNETTLTFTSQNGGSITCLMPNCLRNTTTWPPANSNNPGLDVQISGLYPFQTMVAMFWPGAGQMRAGTFQMPASSRERIQF